MRETPATTTWTTLPSGAVQTETNGHRLTVWRNTTFRAPVAKTFLWAAAPLTGHLYGEGGGETEAQAQERALAFTAPALAAAA